MKAYLFALGIMASVASQSDLSENLLSQLELKIRNHIFHSCKNLSDAQERSSSPLLGDEVVNLNFCKQAGDQITSELIAAFRPIAGHEFQKVLENLDGTYYKQDPNTGLWYIPSQGKSNMIGDGIAKNAESLTHTLDVEFKKLLEAYNSNGLKKRLTRLGSFFRQAVLPPLDNIGNSAAHSVDNIGGSGVSEQSFYGAASLASVDQHLERFQQLGGSVGHQPPESFSGAASMASVDPNLERFHQLGGSLGHQPPAVDPNLERFHQLGGSLGHQLPESFSGPASMASVEPNLERFYQLGGSLGHQPPAVDPNLERFHQLGGSTDNLAFSGATEKLGGSLPNAPNLKYTNYGPIIHQNMDFMKSHPYHK